MSLLNHPYSKYSNLTNSPASSTSASWHNDYRDTAFVYVGGLPLELSEGDVITIMSQFGEPTYINLVRDKDTGKSKGFAFIKYEDQRSTDLAVDNLGGAKIMDRILKVDHTRYKVKEGEIIKDNTYGDTETVAVGNEVEDVDDRRKRRRRSGTEEVEERRPMLREEKELEQLMITHDDDDPMKEYLIQQKREEVAEAIEKYQSEHKSRKHGERRHKDHRHRSTRDGDKDDGRDRRHRSRKAKDEGDDSCSHERHHHRRQYKDEDHDYDRHTKSSKDTASRSRRAYSRDEPGRESIFRRPSNSDQQRLPYRDRTESG